MEHKVAEAEHSRSYARQFFTKFCTPVFLEAFVLTFLAGPHSTLTSLSFFFYNSGCSSALGASSKWPRSWQCGRNPSAHIHVVLFCMPMT